MEYKVGDKVLIRKDLENGYGGAFKMDNWRGKVMTVKAVNLSDYSMQESDYYWNENWIERKVDMFTKDDLKTGTSVVMRNGQQAQINPDGTLQGFYMSEYNDDLTRKDPLQSFWDVMSVHKTVSIWQRTEKITAAEALKRISEHMGKEAISKILDGVEVEG